VAAVAVQEDKQAHPAALVVLAEAAAVATEQTALEDSVGLEAVLAAAVV
jgi:hypothetical protein